MGLKLTKLEQMYITKS